MSKHKLRTLKDMDTNWLAGEKTIDDRTGEEIIIPTVVDVDDLRQAAQEWLNTYNEKDIDSFNVVKEFIRCFFNLKEEK